MSINNLYLYIIISILIKNMSKIIQDVKFQKTSTEYDGKDIYTLIITYNDISYISKLISSEFKSSLFEFDMLETLIYNSNHNQTIGEVLCSMDLEEIKNSQRTLKMTLYFVRDVKPMKTIKETHTYILEEKKLDYDDKIALTVNNLKSCMKFVTIKPTTKIIIVDTPNKFVTYNENTLTINYCIEGLVKVNATMYFQPSLMANTIEYIKQHIILRQGWNSTYKKTKIDIEMSSEYDGIFRKLAEFKTDVVKIDPNMYKELVTYLADTFMVTDKDCTKYELDESKILKIPDVIEYHCKNNFIENIKIYDSTAIIFIDTTKKPNGRKIKYINIKDFEKYRKQFSTYTILDITHDGNMVIEELG